MARENTLQQHTLNRREPGAEAARRPPAPPRWLLALFSGNIRTRAIALIVALAILAITSWATYQSVRALADGARATALLAVLDAKVGALRAQSSAAGTPGSGGVIDAQQRATIDSMLAPRRTAAEPEVLDGLNADAFAFDASGGALTAGRNQATLRTSSEPTPLIRRALARLTAIDPADQRGVVVEPYASHAGTTVVGAWQWLPDKGFGVAVEAAPDEILSPMRYLVITLQILFALLIVAAVIALASTMSLADMKQKRRLGPYHLGGVIETGGMATVHHAEHALLKRPTAVKILKHHLANDELIARFEREVMLTSRLQHPATVEIYDYGRTPDGTFYFAMEYIDGLTLAQLVEKDGVQPVARVAHILKQVCESLREAHNKGLVHRDVKPPNIMVCERGGESDVVKVLDWGLIKDVRANESRNLTQYARVLGTPVYMPPERVRDPTQADPQVDIYGLGAVAYFLLTGRLLFDAPNDFDLKRMVVESDAPRASLHATELIPRRLDDLIARCLAKAPADRPRSVVELISLFTEILRTDPWTPELAADWWQAHRAAPSAESEAGARGSSS